MSRYRFPPDEMRRLIARAIPEELAISAQAPEPRLSFFPSIHARALQPGTQIVEGIRGAGKSFWWAALQSEIHRQRIKTFLPRAQLDTVVKVGPGFGEKPDPVNYPSPRILSKLLETHESREIWRAIIAWQVLEPSGERPAIDNWSERLAWFEKDPEWLEVRLTNIDQELDHQGHSHLILFDALDRTAHEWPAMRQLLKGLLQILLEFRSYRAIRPKAFVRPDMLEDPTITAFPDASKVLNNKVDLFWPRRSLYNLLWQILGNELESGEVFRRGSRYDWPLEDGVYRVPDFLAADENLQRTLFHAITGPWMGRDQRRGFPFTWLPNHLADAKRQTSPRSFLTALRNAAEEPARSGWEYALHFEDIKRGVQEASKIRVTEMQEDYPWVKTLMDTLQEVVVPCEFQEIETRWKNSSIPQNLTRNIETGETHLPPQHLEDGTDGIRIDMENLGIFDPMPDGRINIPDVYRIGFGLRRKGGVKRLRKE